MPFLWCIKLFPPLPPNLLKRKSIFIAFHVHHPWLFNPSLAAWPPLPLTSKIIKESQESSPVAFPLLYPQPYGMYEWCVNGGGSLTFPSCQDTTRLPPFCSSFPWFNFVFILFFLFSPPTYRHALRIFTLTFCFVSLCFLHWPFLRQQNHSQVEDSQISFCSFNFSLEKLALYSSPFFWTNLSCPEWNLFFFLLFLILLWTSSLTRTQIVSQLSPTGTSFF